MNNKIGISVWCIPVQGIENRVQWAAQNGLQGIELDLGEENNPDSLCRPEIRSQYTELRNHWNVAYPSLAVNVFGSPGHGISGSPNQARTRQAIEKSVEAALALNIPLLQLPSFGTAEINSEGDFQNTVELLRYACRCAEGTELLVGSENILSTADQLRLIEQAGHPKLRLYFDTRNPFHMRGFDVAPMLEQVYPHVCEVHVKDGLNSDASTLLGKGNSGFLRSFDVLIQRGYSGWLMLENDYRQIAVDSRISAEDAIKSDIEFITGIWR